MIPYLVKCENNKPNFAELDLDRIERCLDKNLCAICGRVLSPKKLVYVGGPSHKDGEFFGDPPMHLNCARIALSSCPFLKSGQVELWVYIGEGLDRNPVNQLLSRPAQIRHFIPEKELLG